MYYQNHHQVKNPFLKGRNSSGDSGLILSTDAKPRLKWTQDLHERFIEAVKQLGGADKATPKTIMKVMAIPGLTLYHLKSHLQKYRLSKNLNGQANCGLNRIGMMTMMEEKTPDDEDEIRTQPNKNSPANEAMQMQIEVQRRLHEQLEVQRHLQLKIEAQGKYLQSVLEKAQETLGREENLGAAGLKAAKVQLYELVSSAEYTNSCFLEPKEIQNLCTQQMQPTYLADCSLESCLTSCVGAHKLLENNRLRLRTYLGDSTSEQREVKEEKPLFRRMEFTWTEEGLRGTPYLSRMVSDAEQRISYSESSPGKLSIGVGMQDHKLEIRNRKGVNSTTEIDLNNYCTRPPKQLDLNGFSRN